MKTFAEIKLESTVNALQEHAENNPTGCAAGCWICRELMVEYDAAYLEAHPEGVMQELSGQLAVLAALQEQGRRYLQLYPSFQRIILPFEGDQQALTRWAQPEMDGIYRIGYLIH